MLIIILLLGVVVLWLMFLSNPTWGSTVALPSACPACQSASVQRSFVDHDRWYREVGPARVECRRCSARFREHGNGTFVRDDA